MLFLFFRVRGEKDSYYSCFSLNNVQQQQQQNKSEGRFIAPLCVELRTETLAFLDIG